MENEKIEVKRWNYYNTPKFKAKFLKQLYLLQFFFDKTIKIKILQSLIYEIHCVLVIARRCRKQYDKYFSSFSYFSIYFTSFQAGEITGI